MQNNYKIGPLILKLWRYKVANIKKCRFEKSPNKVFIIALPLSKGCLFSSSSFRSPSHLPSRGRDKLKRPLQLPQASPQLLLNCRPLRPCYPSQLVKEWTVLEDFWFVPLKWKIIAFFRECFKQQKLTPKEQNWDVLNQETHNISWTAALFLLLICDAEFRTGCRGFFLRVLRYALSLSLCLSVSVSVSVSLPLSPSLSLSSSPLPPSPHLPLPLPLPLLTKP